VVKQPIIRMSPLKLFGYIRDLGVRIESLRWNRIRGQCYVFHRSKMISDEDLNALLTLR